MKLSWNNLSYTVRMKRTKREMKISESNERYYDKTILKDLTGYINSGEATFIMGSSGSGKTTLLNAL